MTNETVCVCVFGNHKLTRKECRKSICRFVSVFLSLVIPEALCAAHNSFYYGAAKQKLNLMKSYNGPHRLGNKKERIGSPDKIGSVDWEMPKKNGMVLIRS